MRLKWWITALPALLLLPLLALADHARAVATDTNVSAHPVIDRVVLTHPGYTITVSVNGTVRVDFLLNQKGMPRKEIESSYVSYPREKSRQAKVDRRRSDALFALVRSPEFAAVGPEYLASPGTFAYAGHRVIMTLHVYTGSMLARRVMFDSSRKTDWPPPLRRAFDEVTMLGQATGPLPVGPFID
jgi:hypothetical protein